ncbi:integrating conjugative element protein pill, pfgi-1, partial [Escherichia coli]
MLSPVLFRARPSLKLAPDVAQHDLILQVIGVALPENSRATVGDGLQGALRRSGYQTLFTV